MWEWYTNSENVTAMAKQWFEKAAAQGNDDAVEALAALEDA